jgi:hypothetical protein
MKIFSYPTIGVVSIASIIGIIFGQIDQGGGSVSGDGEDQEQREATTSSTAARSFANTFASA